MATFRRALTPGGTYFFTVNTYRRQRILTEPRVYAALKMAIQPVRLVNDMTAWALRSQPDFTLDSTGIKEIYEETYTR